MRTIRAFEFPLTLDPVSVTIPTNAPVVSAYVINGVVKAFYVDAPDTIFNPPATRNFSLLFAGQQLPPVFTAWCSVQMPDNSVYHVVEVL